MHRKESFGHYQCEDMMAKSPVKVMELLENVWSKACVSANQERQALLEFANKHQNQNDPSSTSTVTEIEPWDWRYYAEQVRKEKYDFDDGVLKPYLSLDLVTRTMFEVSNKLYG